MVELTHNELMLINGGSWSLGQTFQVVGGALVVAGSAATFVTTKGISKAVSGAGVAFGIGMIIDAFR